MTNQTLDLENYELQFLNETELNDLNGGHWIENVWKAFQALSTSESINESVNGLNDGFKFGHNQGSGGHGATGTW